MRFISTDEGLASLFVFIITAWLLISRPVSRQESSWPLAYYAILVPYEATWGSFLRAPVVYAALAFALLIRFEFLSTRVLKSLILAEAACLAYILWNCSQQFLVIY
jgi:hypothetical protein